MLPRRLRSFANNQPLSSRHRPLRLWHLEAQLGCTAKGSGFPAKDLSDCTLETPRRLGTMRASGLVSRADLSDVVLSGLAFVHLELDFDLAANVLQTAPNERPAVNLSHGRISFGALLLRWNVDELCLGIGQYCILGLYGQRTAQKRKSIDI